MDEKLKKIIIIVLGVFILVFLFLFLLSSCSSKYSVNEFELMIVDKTKAYYKIHKEELPSQNSTLSLSLSDLVNKGIIDELDKILEKDINCSGNLIIENNNNFYMYSPTLSCTVGSNIYKTENLKDNLLKNVVSSGNGLYNIGDSYYFRGDSVDNYLMFDGILWRIMKINNDNTIRIIESGRREPVVWDDRYNAEENITTGINNYFYDNLNSRIKENLEEIYNSENILSNDAKGYIRKTALCIGKRAPEDSINDGSIECSTTLPDQYLGLIQLNEYIIASLDNNCVNSTSNACRNYNYLSEYSSSYWTITASSEKSSKVYKINTTVMSTGASNSSMARLVINISDNTNVTGSGTENDPYVVSGFKNELKELN